LTVDWSNPNAPVIYATSAEASANRLVRIVDTGATSIPATLASAGTNAVFRGVDFALLPAVWTGNTAGTVDWSAGGPTPWTNWSVSLADGIHLAFQNTNSGGSPLNITANNNTSLTNVSSITFRAGGFGGGAGGTAYTLTGNALTLGTGGVTNNSPTTQTVNLNLTLGGHQTFNAAAAPLAFGGNIALGSGSNNFTLTVAGNANTTLNGVVSDGGSGASALVKTGAGVLTLSGANTYSGGTTVAAGTLLVNNTTGSATGTGAVDVQSGATLGGGNTTGTAGFIGGPVTVRAGGTLAPGNSPGILTVNNNVTFEGGAVFSADVTGTAVGTQYDQLVVGPAGGSNTVDLGGATLAVNFGSFTPSFNDMIFLISNTRTDNLGTIGTFGNPVDGQGRINLGSYFAKVSYVGDFAAMQLMGGNDVVIYAFQPTPEPAHVLLLAAATAAAVRLVRRRNRARRP
jgi:autotransporter-associated beta strand protein